MKAWRIAGLFLVVACIAIPSTALAAGSDRPVLEKLLGATLFRDKNLSMFGNQACVSCHHPSAAFADPDNVRDPKLSPVSNGSDVNLFGGRNAPSAAYAGFSPKLHWNAVDGLFIGGLFWDGRASGLDSSVTAGLGAGPTGDPLADQAKGPILNPVEMALPDEATVVSIVRTANYAWLFELVYPDVLYNDAQIGTAYNNIATAIAAFERSSAVNRFNSRFDKFLRERGGDVSAFGVEIDPATGFRKYVGPPKMFRSRYLTYQEADGLALFNADSEVQMKIGTNNVGGMCYLCHLTTRHNPNYGLNSTQRANPFSADGTYPPLFTDFSYDNLGIPKSTNPLIANNPVDFGLGAETRLVELNNLLPNVDIAAERGKFRVPSLRNVADTPPYGHNGSFPDLQSIVHFYNTRDGGSFPPPEVLENVNINELGNLGLSPAQEAAIVAFMKTLSD
jgi:cytochrome c peroxidase